MKLDDLKLKSFSVQRTFASDSVARINSIDFDYDGKFMLASSDDDIITVYDVLSATVKQTVNSKKYGADVVRFTHARNAILHGSNKVDDSIRYLSLHDYKYLRFFTGHTKKVTSLSTSPLDDTFISCSLDKTVRLWDLGSPVCKGIIRVPSRPISAFDPEGLVFAIGLNSEQIKLYDVRQYEKGPFNTFTLQQDKDCDWIDLKFSPDGKLLLISTNNQVIRMIDSYSGMSSQNFMGYTNGKRLPLEASFTSDSKYVTSGSTDGKIHIWNARSGSRVMTYQAECHTEPIQFVKFNPRYAMFTSACSTIAYWQPSD